MLWGTGTSILGTSWNLHIHSTFLSMQRTKIKHNWIWEIHRADKTRKGSIDRNLLGTWSTWNHLNASAASSQYFDQNLDGILSKFKIFKDNSAVFSAISSWFAKKTVRLLAHPRCHADKLVLVLPGKSQLRLSVSFPLQFVPEKACQQAQSRGPAKVQTCPVGCSVHLKQS